MTETAHSANLRQHRFILRLVGLGIFANGLLVLTNALLSHREVFRHTFNNDVRVSLALIIGMSLIYLSSLISRRKQIAWGITMLVYAFLLGLNVSALLATHPIVDYGAWHLLRAIGVPVAMILALGYYRRDFTVKSDARNLTLALRFIVLVLLVAFLYGIFGFLLLDKHDFHQEISLLQAAHYTVDQFNITTGHALVAYTARGRLFVYSLSLVSTLSLIYAAVSLFQPLRARLTDQSHNRQIMEDLLTRYKASSEDFFKLWPHDKQYFINRQETAGLAFHVQRGVVLVVGDPVGATAIAAQELLDDFLELCYTNDWLPAFIHTEPSWSSFYKANDFTLQKIGQEAIVDLEQLEQLVGTDKYFRNIQARFAKQHYTSEVLLPPHNQALLSRLKSVSDDWLNLPGRSERGLMMAYYDPAYMQACPILVIRDEAGTIQGFMNQIHSFDPEQANFDLLRHSKDALGNSNDFLLMKFAEYTVKQGFRQLNMGLCPLVGLKDENEEDKNIINRTLKFVYSNGNRFYSFTGLYRFKAKYNPHWHNRYIAYRGGIRGFTRTVNALNRAMSRTHTLHHKTN